MSLDFWRTTALGIVALGQTAFALLYTTFPWYKSFLGRSLFFKALALCLVLDTYMVYRVTKFPHADVVFVCLYLMLAVGVWFQFVSFLRVALLHKQHDLGNEDVHE